MMVCYRQNVKKPVSEPEKKGFVRLTAGSIFTLNERCVMTSFTTKDRAVVGSDGSVEYVPWSVLCSDYALPENGIRQPRSFRAVWNCPDGDFVYFDGKITAVTYQ